MLSIVHYSIYLDNSVLMHSLLLIIIYEEDQTSRVFLRSGSGSGSGERALPLGPVGTSPVYSTPICVSLRIHQAFTPASTHFNKEQRTTTTTYTCTNHTTQHGHDHDHDPNPILSSHLPSTHLSSLGSSSLLYRPESSRAQSSPIHQTLHRWSITATTLHTTQP